MFPNIQKGMIILFVVLLSGSICLALPKVTAFDSAFIKNTGEEINSLNTKFNDLQKKTDSLKTHHSFLNMRQEFFQSELAEQTAIFSVIVAVFLAAFSWFNFKRYDDKLEEHRREIGKEVDSVKNVLNNFTAKIEEIQIYDNLSNANIEILLADMYKTKGKSELQFNHLTRAAAHNCRAIKLMNDSHTKKKMAIENIISFLKSSKACLSALTPSQFSDLNLDEITAQINETLSLDDGKIKELCAEIIAEISRRKNTPLPS